MSNVPESSIISSISPVKSLLNGSLASDEVTLYDEDTLPVLKMQTRFSVLISLLKHNSTLSSMKGNLTTYSILETSSCVPGSCRNCMGVFDGEVMVFDELSMTMLLSVLDPRNLTL